MKLVPMGKSLYARGQRVCGLGIEQKTANCGRKKWGFQYFWQVVDECHAPFRCNPSEFCLLGWLKKSVLWKKANL